MIRSVIRSCGSYLPRRIVTNADLEKQVDTSDEWIVQRTGIRQRHIAGEDETTSAMAAAAARDALAASGLFATDIDGIIVATSTPDLTFPSVAVMVQAALDIPPCVAFDLQAVCSGFIYALTVADNFIRSGANRRILVIGAEKFSSILDWNDRATCVLFGDGAGAVILERAEGEGTVADRGILSTHLYADGRYKDILCTTGGTSTNQISGYVSMQGKEVFKHAVANLAGIVEEVLTHNGIGSDSLQWLLPHQANVRIIEATAKKLDMDMSQVILTVDRHGNTSAASIPLALADAVTAGRVKRGDLILAEALGAGLTWGAALLRY